MSVGTTNMYQWGIEHISRATIDLDSDPFKMAWLTATYTPNANDSVWGDISTNEIVSGNGYSAGGANCAVNVSRVGATVTWTLSEVDWVTSGGTIPASGGPPYWWAIYSTANKNGKNLPLLCYGLGDQTPAALPVTQLGATLRYIPNPNGVFTL